MTAPTPYDTPTKLSDRIIFPSMRYAYLAGAADQELSVGQVAANLSACREMLDQVRAERDQARQMLADAPHADDCTLYWLRGTCTCWKSGL